MDFISVLQIKPIVGWSPNTIILGVVCSSWSFSNFCWCVDILIIRYFIGRQQAFAEIGTFCPHDCLVFAFP